MKDIDVNEVMENYTLFRSSTTGESLSRIQEMQKVYDKFNNIWIWVDMTVANLNDVPVFLLSFVYFKLLEMLSDANESQQRLKDIKWRQLPWFKPTPKKAREDMLRLYEWAERKLSKLCYVVWTVNCPLYRGRGHWGWFLGCYTDCCAGRNAGTC